MTSSKNQVQLFSQAIRPRRNRRSEAIRNGIAETHLSPEHFVLPLFLKEGKNQREEIKSMPDYFRLSLDQAYSEIQDCLDLGINKFALFPVISETLKNAEATEALNPNGFAIECIRQIKQKFKNVILFTDVALDPFNSDGHDGLVKNGEILNDQTVQILADMALLQAKAGADYVSPSDMMDGRVRAIRHHLDNHGYTQTGIMSYTAKYASAFYGPFRDALDSAPKFGDKKTYQMDYRNSKECLLELMLDLKEGADMVMVKPALSYLDIIRKIKQKSSVPVTAYNVSGEYAMIKFASRARAIDEKKAVLESLTSIRRAGADLIFTYFAKSAAGWINAE